MGPRNCRIKHGVELQIGSQGKLNNRATRAGAAYRSLSTGFEMRLRQGADHKHGKRYCRRNRGVEKRDGLKEPSEINNGFIAQPGEQVAAFSTVKGENFNQI